MTRTLVFTLTLPDATPSNNVIKQLHYRVYKKLREQWRAWVLEQLGGVLPAVPLELSDMEIERHSAGLLDWDNVYGGLKPLLDCLVCASDRNPDGLGLIRDDNPKNMPSAPAVTQLPAKRGAGRTVVRIYDLKTS
ncbi:hypothetical protein RugamoR57_37360 [Duganella caerulea]|uniref:hypothetical protein n=1 Tax=Duganella caerulea TaxID=2885762 RepID=UPI0030E9F707